MEHVGIHEDANRSDLEFNCQKRSGVTETKFLESVVKFKDGGVMSSTPEKGSEKLAGKSKVVEEFELPERYKSIVDLFRQMSCSLRLLGLCKKSTTFRNVCPQVEILAKRKFSYKHLAQIKYILPEAVQIQKIIVHDEESQCMRPDLKITLVFDVVKDHKQKSDFIALCRLFFSRVVDFSCGHPEDCDIPEATLPQPFSHHNESASSEIVSGDHDTSVRLNSGAANIEHIEKVSVEDALDQIVKCSSTPLKVTYSPVGSSRACVTPLITHSSEAANLMVETPTQLPPKRASLETEEGLVPKSNKASNLSEKPAKRSLEFTFEAADRYMLANTVEKTEHVKTSHHNTTQDSKSEEHTKDGEDVNGGHSSTVPSPGQNDERTKMTCKVSPSLCGCIPVVHQIFRSVDYSPITKQELVFKILINSLDVEERGTVEEHLEQLELFLPNWISKQISPSGDLMYSVKKLPDVSALLAELQS